MSRPNNNAEIFPWLQMIRSEGVGPVLFDKLLAEFDTAEQALAAMPTLRQRGKPLLPANRVEIEREIAALKKLGGAWLCRNDAHYPDQLRAIDDAPPVLSTLGDMNLLQRPMIGIVGARNASINGRKLAAQIARDLGKAGYVIASGLARGIDAAVHEAALGTGTVAVVANGVDIVYPPENKNLHDAIIAHGLIVSENPVGAQPAASLFPRRNRIISGLSQAVIIIEAAAKSGSLITARFALDQGRDVFAVPGNPLDPRAAGPNGLIKSGQAFLVESAADILQNLGTLNLVPREVVKPAKKIAPMRPAETKSAVMTNDQARHVIMDCISHAPCTIDQIIFATQLPTNDVLTFLMEMELSGRINRLPGDRVVLV